MSSDDVVILTLTVGPAICGVIAIRLLFRHSATTGTAVVTPQVFAIIGGLVGISFGMVFFADPNGRVVIETGSFFLVGGICLGAWVGAVARKTYARMNRGRSAVFILVVTLLGGSIGAPIGWIVGDINAPRAVSYDTIEGYYRARDQISASRMMLGSAIGSGVGFLLGLTEIAFRRRGAT